LPTGQAGRGSQDRQGEAGFGTPYPDMARGNGTLAAAPGGGGGQRPCYFVKYQYSGRNAKNGLYVTPFRVLFSAWIE
jgi:hypothetical protein